MKKIFCIDNDSDVNRIQQYQIKNLINDQESVVYIYDSEQNIKQHVLEKLDQINDEVVLFFPVNSLLIKPINEEVLSYLLNIINTKDIDYIRLRKIGNNSNNNKLSDNVYSDHSNIFYLTPHLIKLNTLKNILNKTSAIRELFWHSIETKDIKGAYYFDINKDQIIKQEKTVGWKSDAFDTFCGILSIHQKWDGSFLQCEQVKSIMSEYNILPEDKGIDYNGCCT